MTVQEKRLKLLDETANFYNLSNRCVNKMGGCRYHLPGKKGCAIGRKISIDLAKKLDLNDISVVSDDNIFNQLPDELKELGQAFLTNIQALHDNTLYWCDTGLSEEGKKRYILIKDEFC